MIFHLLLTLLLLTPTLSQKFEPPSLNPATPPPHFYSNEQYKLGLSSTLPIPPPCPSFCRPPSQLAQVKAVCSLRNPFCAIVPCISARNRPGVSCSRPPRPTAAASPEPRECSLTTSALFDGFGTHCTCPDGFNPDIVREIVTSIPNVACLRGCVESNPQALDLCDARELDTGSIAPVYQECCTRCGGEFRGFCSAPVDLSPPTPEPIPEGQDCLFSTVDAFQGFDYQCSCVDGTELMGRFGVAGGIDRECFVPCLERKVERRRICELGESEDTIRARIANAQRQCCRMCGGTLGRLGIFEDACGRVV